MFPRTWSHDNYLVRPEQRTLLGEWQMNREGPEPQPSFDKIYSAYCDKAHTLAFRMTGDAEAALDIVQEAFIAIYNNLHKFRGESAISTWMYAIVKNTCRCENLVSFSLKQGWLEKYQSSVAPARIESEIRVFKDEIALLKTLPEIKADIDITPILQSAATNQRVNIFSKRKVK
jgi:RNA polymerase sigma factor (sigma-70 family)